MEGPSGGAPVAPVAPAAPAAPALSGAAQLREHKRTARMAELLMLDPEQLAKKICDMEATATSARDQQASNERNAKRRWVGHWKRLPGGVNVWVDGAGKDNLGRPFIRPAAENASPNRARAINLSLGFLDMRKRRGLAAYDGTQADCCYKSIKRDIDLLHDYAYDGGQLQDKVPSRSNPPRAARAGGGAEAFARARARAPDTA